MHWAIFGVVIYVMGIVSGIAFLRYGAGFGVKMVYQIREGMPLEEVEATEEDTWQTTTSDELDNKLEDNLVS